MPVDSFSAPVNSTLTFAVVTVVVVEPTAPAVALVPVIAAKPPPEPAFDQLFIRFVSPVRAAFVPAPEDCAVLMSWPVAKAWTIIVFATVVVSVGNATDVSTTFSVVNTGAPVPVSHGSPVVGQPEKPMIRETVWFPVAGTVGVVSPPTARRHRTVSVVTAPVAMFCDPEPTFDQPDIAGTGSFSDSMNRT